MKFFIFTAIIGFTCWIGSEVLEIIFQGYNSTVYYLTTSYHILAGIGIWGLHYLQFQPENRLSYISTLLISITYFALAYFPIQVMNSGISVSEFLELHPVYKIPGLISLVGFILFGLSILKAGYFPKWAGVIIILGTLIYAIAMVLKLQIVVNINNCILSLSIIYLCIFGLRKLQNESL